MKKTLSPLMDITFDRFQDYHMNVGEDFCDQSGHRFNELKFVEWLVLTYPEKEVEIRSFVEKEGSSLELLSFIENYTDFVTGFEGTVDDNYEDKKFYTDLASFMNTENSLKEEANIVLCSQLNLDEYDMSHEFRLALMSEIED